MKLRIFGAEGTNLADLSPFADMPLERVNLTWTKFYQGPKGLGYLQSPIVMSQSKNGGKQWSAVKQVSDASHPYDQGSQSATAPDGTHARAQDWRRS